MTSVFSRALIFPLLVLLFLYIPASLSDAQDTKNPDTSPVEVKASVDTTTFTQRELAVIRSLGPWPLPIPADPGNELSGLRWAEKLGERLFIEPDLSGERNIACVSCHQPGLGFVDGLPKAQGQSSHHRNTQSLWNAGLQRWFGWDGGADSLWAASLRPILSPIEMNADIKAVAARLRDKPYIVEVLLALPTTVGTYSDEHLVVLMAKAIGAYVRTLVSAETDFDRFREALLADDADRQQSYSESAKRGLKIFIGEANCHLCHFGPNFSNGEFHDTGRPFFTGVGQVDPGRYSGIKRVREDKYNLASEFNGVKNPDETRKTLTVKSGQVNFGQWRTPSLRNLADTGPYMHDGSLPTLRDVVDAYADIDPDRLHADGEAILKPLDLDEGARNDLVSFLESLSVLSD